MRLVGIRLGPTKLGFVLAEMGSSTVRYGGGVDGHPREIWQLGNQSSWDPTWSGGGSLSLLPRVCGYGGRGKTVCRQGGMRRQRGCHRLKDGPLDSGEAGRYNQFLIKPAVGGRRGKRWITSKARG